MMPFDRMVLRGKPCPKCEGGNGLHASGQIAFGWSMRWHDGGAVYGNGSGSHDTYWPERLDVSCTNCGYSFEMAPADAKVPA